MTTRRATLAILVFSLANCAPATRPAAPTPAAGTAAALHTLLSGAAPLGFSGAVLATRGREVIFTGGYGMADRERGVPITPRTAFTSAR
jgi:CubicO group peptidase (beta-lactamase class C family)